MNARRETAGPFFFDLDGTLADSADGIIASLEQALAMSGMHAPAVGWRQFIGPPLPQMLDAALPGLNMTQRENLVAAYRSHYASTGIFVTTAFAGVPAVLQRLNDAHRAVYLLTNKPQAAAETVMMHLNLKGFVREIVGGDPAGGGTKAERAAALVTREGITGGIFIGDGLDDLQAAERIGARFFLAGWGYGTARVLAERPDVAVLRQPADILAAIEVERSRE